MEATTMIQYARITIERYDQLAVKDWLGREKRKQASCDVIVGQGQIYYLLGT